MDADEYEEGEPLHARATEFLARTKWEGLTAIASSLRSNISSRLEPKYSTGHLDMVRCITFEDGVKWVARLRMPDLQDVFGSREALDPESVTRMEVATMRYLRLKTAIPVPEAFAYDVRANNTCGAPYILMSYIHGTTASDLRQQKGCDYYTYGTTEQDHKFRQELARIQVQLAALQFNQIGGLYETENGFEIGPETVTGKGPWSTADAYYEDCAKHAEEVASRDAPDEVKERESYHLPSMVPPLMAALEPRNGTFGLANRDLGAHNLLVNDDFDILGLTDFDGVMAAPAGVVAQLPSLTSGLQREPPGHVETKPFVIERIEMDMPKLKEYEEMLSDAALEGGYDAASLCGRLSSLAFSEAASVVQGLEEYGMHRASKNDIWMGVYQRLGKDAGVEMR